MGKSKKHHVLGYINSRNHPICDKCIELALGYEFDTVNHINRPLSRKGIINRYKDKCPSCSVVRLVNSHKNLST